ncbi:MAG: hypothetical protein Q7V19_01490 [Bacteroidales bacterium]|nr:hypothetical protein [Bacteroidales bacterium]
MTLYEQPLLGGAALQDFLLIVDSPWRCSPFIPACAPSPAKVKCFILSTIILLKTQPKIRLHHKTGTGARTSTNGGAAHCSHKGSSKGGQVFGTFEPAKVQEK